MKQRTRRALIIAFFLTGLIFAAPPTHNSPTLPDGRNIKDVLGVTHVNGRYCLTDKDFLNEGADQLLTLGTRVIKVWFYAKHYEPPRAVYPYHSDWPDVKTLSEAARLPYYKALFQKPFSTFVLAVTSMGRTDDYWRSGITPEQEADETRQFYELTKTLLADYADTGKTFVLQHWEGDWMVRGHFDSNKDPDPAALDNMAKWLNARQAGITKARNELNPKGVTIYHAAEVNKVYIAMHDGRPNMINCVIPKTCVDLVSYSAWDTAVDCRDNPAAFRDALDFIAKNTPDHPVLGDKNFYVGEFGVPENSTSPEDLQKIIRNTVDSALGRGARYVIYWQLYCNELKNPNAKPPVTNNQDVNGFWLIRPDGSKVWAWDYFHSLLN